MTPFEVGIFSFVVILFLLAFGVPVYACFTLVGIFGLAILKGFGPAFGTVASIPFAWTTSYVLSTIPFFLLMGHLVNQAGISSELFNSSKVWFGRVPGGLAMATNAACTIFAACTGSSFASAATMGAIAVPEMMKRGYSKRLAAGTVAAGGTLGILIPPSTLMIIFGLLTETSIGQLFVAGIIPGLMLSAMFMAYIFFRVRLDPNLGPPATSYPMREKLRAAIPVWSVIVLFVLIIGGLYGGFFVPSEAGAVGAVGALAIALLKRRLTKEGIRKSLVETGRTTAMIFAILIGSMVYNNLVSLSGLPTQVSQWVTNLPLPKIGILIAILIIYIPLGMFLDVLALTVLTLPIFFPVVTHVLGVDPVHYGIIHVLIAEMALITPPVGMNVYVIYGVSKDISMEEIFKGSLPFFAVMLLAAIIIVVFPDISLFLPRMMRPA